MASVVLRGRDRRKHTKQRHKKGGQFQKDIANEDAVMDEKIARLRAHQKNIDRYQRLLQTKLTEVEKRYVEKRLSEERFSIRMLDFMAPSSKVYDLRDVLQ
jgi:hypothetical protein